GLSPALGAFLAGMLLAESPFATQIRADIGSLRTLFVTLFFTSIGMLANPGWFINHWLLALAWLVVVFAGKAIIIYSICLIFRVSHHQALATGITLGQIGEFSFVLATIAKSGGLIYQEGFYLIVTISILSMFFAPYMVTYAVPLANGILGKLSVRYREKLQQEQEPSEKIGGKIFIIGFGPAGQRVAERLIEQHIQSEVIELNPVSAGKAKKMDLTVHLGDATRNEVLLHAGIQEAYAVVVTVPDPRTSRAIIENVRQINPNSTVIVRSRYHIAQWELQKAGANIVVDEENMVGRMLAQELTGFLHQANQEAMACALAGERPQVVHH
ncbi:MAG: cation:proton antiporter, partial [Desulfobacterales bacterium]